MTSKLTYWGSIGLAAASVVVANPAFAAGTTAGASITNTATVTYQVGGVAQGSVTTNVVPGQANAVTTFQLTNSSNEVLDFELAATQIAGGTAAHGGTDTFNVGSVRIYRDNTSSGTVGSWDTGDTLVTYIDELAVDTPIRLFIVADIPAGLANNAVAGVQLRATAREGGTVGSQGAAITETTSANTAATLVATAAGAPHPACCRPTGGASSAAGVAPAALRRRSSRRSPAPC
jgi:hypothetical protein